MLHLTNGSSVSLPEAGLPGESFYWADVLHEGPVPELPLDELTEVRARFLTQYAGTFEATLADLRRRDRKLASWREQDELVLWFEHDLYDQLQLIQVLSWIYREPPARTRVSAVFVDQYLGLLGSKKLAQLFPMRQAVTEEQFAAADAAWSAFTASEPEGLTRVNAAALPYLGPALVRHCEQFPSTRNGLSRSEQQILDVLAQGAETLADAFYADQKREEAIFCGDTVFATWVERMARCPHPLVTMEGAGRFSEIRLGMTEAGRRVMDGEADFVVLNGLDRWLGGVHLEAEGTVWRWDGRGFHRA